MAEAELPTRSSTDTAAPSTPGAGVLASMQALVSTALTSSTMPPEASMALACSGDLAMLAMRFSAPSSASGAASSMLSSTQSDTRRCAGVPATMPAVELCEASEASALKHAVVMSLLRMLARSVSTTMARVLPSMHSW